MIDKILLKLYRRMKDLETDDALDSMSADSRNALRRLTKEVILDDTYTKKERD